MAVQLATATVNAMADAAVDLIDGGGGPGTIKVYTASQPANANTAVAAQTLLATFTLDDPAFGSAAAGVCTLAAVPVSTTGAAAGTAAWFRCESSTPGTVFDGSVTATGGGGQLQLNTVSISAGVNIEITSGTFTMPAALIMPIAFQSATTATGNNGGNNAATVTVTVPAGTANGDMLILAVVVSEALGVAPTCAGWTLKATHNGVQDGAGPPPYDTDLTTSLFYRRASSEPASYAVTTDGTYGNYAALAMLRYTGVIAAGDPFRTSATVSRTNAIPFAASQTSVALTGVQAADMALHLSGTAMGGWNTNAYDLSGPGGGWTERGEVYMTTASTGKPAVLLLEQLGTGTAPVVTATGTAVTASNVYWVFAAGALMPEPAAAPVANRIFSTAVRRASTW